MAIEISDDLRQLALELAVDSSWSLVESCSVNETEDGIEWFVIGDDYANQLIEDGLKLLIGLGLAEIHPRHKTWVRCIAEL